MKTLIVKYLPTGASSNTKKLLDVFLEEATNQNIEVLDLLKEQAPLFDEKSIQAYYKRNYGGQKLDLDEAKLLEKNDKLIAQLKSADVVVFAYPMHNFGIPAAVKAYLDAVIFNGETFEAGKKLMAGKKVLTLFTAGGIYSEEVFNFDYPNWNTIALQSKAMYGFMGFDDIETIGTSLRDVTVADSRIAEVRSRLKNIIKKWF
ncbi:MAG: hypothetical protein FJ368_04670 [Pelagibacterales bacterium]|nr:hypothetical protein [Pelagibacterales bacterium]